MKRLSLSRILSVAAGAIISAMLSAHAAHAQVASGYNFTNIISFTGGGGSQPGDSPESGVSIDGSQNLYGTTQTGGSGNGEIWKYNTTTASFTPLVSFGAGTNYNPFGPVTIDGSGNLYGTTETGGTSSDGVVWKFNQATSTYTTLVNFTGISGGELGANPYSGVTMDSSGNLLGTTTQGAITGTFGANGYGVVWKYNPTNSTYTTPVQFQGNSSSISGQNPYGNLAIDASGNYYGTTYGGGNGTGNGVIFKYNPSTSTYTTLQLFGAAASGLGSTYAGPTIGPDGNLYGASATGTGATANGAVWKYNLSTNTFSTLFAFTGTSGAYAGATPLGGVTFDSAGNLYGTTSAGGAANDGVVWKYNPTASTYTDLVSFTGAAGNASGASPDYENLLIASNGTIIGTTSSGGPTGFGNVFEISSSGATPEPAALALLLPAVPAILARRRRASRHELPV